MIPRFIHRIWLGSDIPPEFDDYWQRWRELFPDHELRTWLERDLRDLGMPDHTWAGCTYAEQSDIARLRVVNELGGIYADCDVEPLVRFDALWSGDDQLIAFQQSLNQRVMNGLFAAAPGALGFVERFVERNARRHGPDVVPTLRTGPFAFTAALDYMRTQGVRMRVYPPAFVDLQGIEQFAVARCRFRDAPGWKAADNPAEPVRAPLRDLMFDARLIPLRLRRRMSRLLT